MEFISTRLPYRQTGEFTKLVLDYIDQSPSLKSFYSSTPSLQGVKQAIEQRKKHAYNRKTLVDCLNEQYAGITTTSLVKQNIERLLSGNCFTVTTAHQNNLFTGPLYFIYKIIHAIRLSEHLIAAFPENHFVPVFYMGTEDADLAELNHIWLNGDKIEWKTNQTGAVGRMKTDKQLTKLIDKISGQLSVFPNGTEIISTIQKFYKEGSSIQQATFEFVNWLFSEYGLVILLPDSPALKKQAADLFQDELLNQTSGKIVESTTAKLDEFGYDAQAHPREINLFYLIDDKRERIVKQGENWQLSGKNSAVPEKVLLDELSKYPERFSPNVILRGLYQEMILPNIAFIGGGGELSYWLQFRGLFDQYKIPFPVLVLRNSFQIVEQRWQETIAKLDFPAEEFFRPEQDLMNRLVLRQSEKALQLNGSLSETEKLYEALKNQAIAVDRSLEKHVESLKVKTLNRLRELEKKMLRAEKRKFTAQQRQIQSVRSQFFPGGDLQERKDNLLYYYAKWGRDFIRGIHKHSLTLEQEFTILQEK